MSYFKSIFLSMTILLVVATLFTLTGCDAGSGCGNSCSGGLFCPNSKAGCECVASQRGCGSFSYNEQSGRCKISNCDSCGLFVGTCQATNSIPKEDSLSKYISVFPHETGCDIFAGEYSEQDCENITNEKQCESMEVVLSDYYSEPKECWFYNCKECSLDLPFYEEELAELQLKD